MEELSYYPLVDDGKGGRDMRAAAPMLSANEVSQSHKMWLTEAAPDCYRLGSAYRLLDSAIEKLRLHCPKCGAVLDVLTMTTPERQLSVYYCDDCIVRLFTR